MIEEKLHWIPISLPLVFIATVTITYSMAVSKGHVFLTSYISHSGNLPPESCIFSQFINIIAVMCMFITICRYRQLQNVIENNEKNKGWNKMNCVTLWLGLISGLGISIVGNFQVANLFAVYFFGAGCLYCAVVVMFLLAELKADEEQVHFKWKSFEPGYKEFLTAVVAQWILTVAVLLYISTFYFEFRHYRFVTLQVYERNLRNDMTDQVREDEVTSNSTVSAISYRKSESPVGL